MFVGSPVEADEKDVSCLGVMRNTILLLVLIYSFYSCTLDCPQMNTSLMQNFTVAFCQIICFNLLTVGESKVNGLSKTVCLAKFLKIKEEEEDMRGHRDTVPGPHSIETEVTNYQQSFWTYLCHLYHLKTCDSCHLTKIL